MTQSLLLKAALHPLPNVAVMITVAIAIGQLGFVPAAIVIVALATSYIVLGPRVKRNKAKWTSLAPRPAAPLVSAVDRSAWPSPLVIVHHTLVEGAHGHNAVTEALQLNYPDLASAVVCIPRSNRFHFPLSRFVINSMGGIMPYSRSVLLQLLGKRKHTVVVHHRIEVARGAASTSLARKGVFSAALMRGAAVLPSIAMEGGKVVFGDIIPAVDNVAAPTTEQVVQLAGRYSKNLTALYDKHNAVKGRALTVTK
jgi:hypothetical protein